MIVTAIVGVVASAALTVLVARETAKIEETEFNNSAEDRRADIQFGIDGYIKSLTAVGVFLQVTNMNIDRVKLWHIAETLRRINPGTLDVAPAVRVTKAERAAFETRMRAQGRTDFQIREMDATDRLVAADERDEYFPTLTVETPSGTGAADGSDAAADPISRQLLARARDENRIVTALPRKLLIGGLGFNIWAPVFRFDSATDTLEDRRKNLIGYAAVTIRIDQMFGSILRASADNPVDIYIADPDAASGDRLIYWDSWQGRQTRADIPAEAALLAGLHWDGKIAIGNRQWRMIVTPAVPLGGGLWGLQALSVLAIGITLTIMIMSYLLVSRHRTLRLELLMSNLRETADELAESESKFRTILKTAADGILVADIQSRKFIEGNPSIVKMLGYSQAELARLELSDIHRLEDMPAIYESFEKLAKGEIKIATDIPVRRKNNSVFFADITTAPLKLGGRQCQVGFFRDVTERRQNAEIITHRAHHDSLTGLVNRQVFLEKVNEAIDRANRGEKAFAILFLDLDHFKDVNDTLGHPTGDELLRSVANRLLKCLRTTDIVTRFGGDEFAVLLTFVGGSDEAGMLATKLIDVVGEPVILGGNSIPVTTSIGISLYGTDSNDAETLMTHADLALHRAKADGRGRYSFFTEEMDKEVRTRVALIGELRDAIKSNQLFVVYQLQVNDETGVIIGVEGLVRWQHPERGVLSPAEFIEVAESSGLIVGLGDWVLHNVCRQARLWLDSGIDLASISVSLNISPLQFKEPLELKANIERILSETGLPPAILELELTEMTLMAAGQSTHNVLSDLRKMGIRIAIDDFGTGYSSLSYLIRYPVDRIKIAQEFMLNLTSDPASKVIVKSTIGLAHDLGLQVIAEGVETQEQLDLLRSWNCHLIQGYYYARPLSAEAMEVHLRRGTMASSRALSMPS